MSKCQELWIERGNLRCNKICSKEIPKLATDQILVAIDKFALTSNNFTYGLTGDTIDYWSYFPTEEQWGKIPVWACDNVIESHSDDIKVGERLWEFFPMRSHVILTPARIRDDQFAGMAERRFKLPSLYNHYRRTTPQPIKNYFIESSNIDTEVQ
jgi:hypothetical protein